MITVHDLSIYIDRLATLFNSQQVSHCHGLQHALKVLSHVEQAIKITSNIESSFDCFCLRLAALLHDADDRKFFPMNKNYENVNQILYDVDGTVVECVINIIKTVSSSQNGDSIPETSAQFKPYYLLVRYADRLEAIGTVGVSRCYIYTKLTNNPLYTSTTEIPSCENDIWTIASLERYYCYKGNSVSMIDHFYDKLLRLSFFPIQNSYFDNECLNRRNVLIEFILLFAKNGTIDDKMIEEFLARKSNDEKQ